jgi:NMD protein affecting ribosome stability and mRNA decay
MVPNSSPVLALAVRAVDGRRAARRPSLGLGVKAAAVASNLECPRCGDVSSDFVRGVCRTCYMRDYNQRRLASSVTVIHDSYGRRLCIECREPGTYAHGLCAKCYMRDYRRRHRMLRTCAICGASFQSPRRDALYCSRSCLLWAPRCSVCERRSVRAVAEPRPKEKARPKPRRKVIMRDGCYTVRESRSAIRSCSRPSS